MVLEALCCPGSKYMREAWEDTALQLSEKRQHQIYSTMKPVFIWGSLLLIPLATENSKHNIKFIHKLKKDKTVVSKKTF